MTDERKPEDKKADGLAKKGEPKYDAQVWAGLVDDPSRLRQLQREAREAEEAAKKPKK